MKTFFQQIRPTLIAAALFGAMTIFSFGVADAQSAQEQDTACEGFGQNKLTIDLGLSANATLFANGNDMSPYYSKFGFGLQIPLMAHWQFAPMWQFSTGLRYDFSWEPIYYSVQPAGTTLEDMEERGITFYDGTTPTTQKSFAFHSYVGIPVELKWSPLPDEKGLIDLSLDLFFGVAVTQHIQIEDIIRNADGTMQYEGYNNSNYNAMNPLKLEIGLTLSSDRIGLIHGIRLFTNLLPSYKDYISNEKIYLSGISMFL